jgi:hypothetical protein
MLCRLNAHKPVTFPVIYFLRRWANPKYDALLNHGNFGHKQQVYDVPLFYLTGKTAAQRYKFEADLQFRHAYRRKNLPK